MDWGALMTCMGPSQQRQLDKGWLGMGDDGGHLAQRFDVSILSRVRPLSPFELDG